MMSGQEAREAGRKLSAGSVHDAVNANIMTFLLSLRPREHASCRYYLYSVFIFNGASTCNRGQNRSS